MRDVNKNSAVLVQEITELENKPKQLPQFREWGNTSESIIG
jgi:hypothetical protein